MKHIHVVKIGESGLGQTKNIAETFIQIKQYLEDKQAQGFSVVLVLSAFSGHSRKIKKTVQAAKLDDLSNASSSFFHHGEFFSAHLLEQYLIHQSVDCKAFIYNDVPLQLKKKSNHFTIEYLQMDGIHTCLNRNVIPIIPGFIGREKNGSYAALSFDASDTLCVKLTHELEQSECSFVKDPGGIYSANQRRVPKAKILNHISYQQVLNWTQKGQKIIFPEALEFAQEYNIKLNLRSLNINETVTQISNQACEKSPYAIAYKTLNDEDFSVYTLGQLDLESAQDLKVKIEKLLYGQFERLVYANNELCIKKVLKTQLNAVMQSLHSLLKLN